MTNKEREEITTLGQLAIQLLLSTVPGQTVGRDLASLRLHAGLLSASIDDQLIEGTLASSFVELFNEANDNGARFNQTDQMIKDMLAYEYITAGGQYFTHFILRMCLILMARIIARLEFKSRDDAETYLRRYVLTMEPVIEVSADSGDIGTYQALLELQAAVVNDVSTRGRLLARIVSYKYVSRLPALYIANRLYADAERTDEIIDENKPIHPAFMPLEGRVLSS